MTGNGTAMIGVFAGRIVVGASLAGLCAAKVVEELLRYEPPVQFINRFALTDTEITRMTIPKGAGIHHCVEAPLARIEG